MGSITGNKINSTPAQAVLKAIEGIRSGAIESTSIQSLAMSAASQLAAAVALHRARLAGRIGKGGKGILKRATQRAAGVLAMRAATSAAITGTSDGVQGADPTVIQEVCTRLSKIFQNHGAVPLKSPLLRPRPATAHSLAVGGPAEVIDTRGTVLLLPEDLCAPFARAVGRGGSAAANIKRYDIDRVHHKAIAGGHPRESLEATFDIVMEDSQTSGRQIEVESIFVASQAMAMLAPPESPQLPFGAMSPIWYLRLTHTRLADSILEICEVPSKESIRRACLAIFSASCAPGPSYVSKALRKKGKKRTKQKKKANAAELLDAQLSDAVENQSLPIPAANKLRAFITKGCMPLPCNIEEATDKLLSAVLFIRSSDKEAKSDPRRMKRYEEIGKILKSLKNLIASLGALGVGPLLGSGKQSSKGRVSRPLYISLDLGLRQRRKHYHGQLLFQCIVLPDSYFEDVADTGEEHTNDYVTSSNGPGMKVAEGGRFDDLVRKYRPPGNFGSAIFNHYTTAPIPQCMGVRFAVGKLVELLYYESSVIDHGEKDSSVDFASKFSLERHGIDFLRRSLGHPLKMSSCVKCMVASPNGMDASSSAERFLVAATLWAEGISAEYMPQSGVMLSLLKRIKEEAGREADESVSSLLLLACVSINEHSSDIYSFLSST